MLSATRTIALCTLVLVSNDADAKWLRTPKKAADMRQEAVKRQAEHNKQFWRTAQKSMKSQPNGFFKRLETSWRINPFARPVTYNHHNESLVVRPLFGIWTVSAKSIMHAWNSGSVLLGPKRFLRVFTKLGRIANKGWEVGDPLGRVRVTLRNRIHARGKKTRQALRKLRSAAWTARRDRLVKEMRNVPSDEVTELTRRVLAAGQAEMNELTDFVMENLADPDTSSATADAAVYPVEGEVSFDQEVIVEETGEVTALVTNNKHTTVDARIDAGIAAGLSGRRSRVQPHVTKVMDSVRTNKMRIVVKGKVRALTQTVDNHTVRATVALGASDSLASANLVSIVKEFYDLRDLRANE